MSGRNAALLIVLVLASSCARREESAPPPPAAHALDAGQQRRFEEVTIRQLMQGPGLTGTPPSALRFSADGRSLFFQWNDPTPLDSLNAGAPENAYEHYLELADRAATYRLDVSGRAIEKLGRARADTTVADESAWDRAKRRRAEIREGDVWTVSLEPPVARRLTQTADAERAVQISPDGATVYFTRDGQVYAMPFAGGTLRQLTNLKTGDDPRAKKPNAQRKYLVDQQKELFAEFKERGDRKKREKEEEKHPKTLYVGAGFAVTRALVSPGGGYVAVLLTREAEGTRKPVVPLIVTESGYTETEEARAHVGDSQDETKIAFVDLAADSLVWFESDPSVALDMIAWSPAEDVLLVRGIPADWHDRWFWAASPAERTRDGRVAARVLDHFRDTAWVDGPAFYETGAWLPDGRTVYFISEPQGWGHLYTVTLSGRREQLTHGEFEVYEAWFDEAGARWFVLSNEGRSGSQRLWTMDAGGSNRRLVTPDPGVYQAVFSPDMSCAGVLRSTATAPAELFLLDTATGALDGPLTRSTTQLFRSFAWPAPEQVTYRASDGVDVHADLLRPERFGAAPNGAGVIFVHGAGYLQNVIDGWSFYYREYMFHCFLAARGYTVLNVDYRGSAGYGRDCRTAIYKHMGGRDLDDVVDGARYLVREHGVGQKQVGVYGGSYGGFLTLMALFKYPAEVTSGAALRSVTDWAHYNHWYTVRILGEPSKDPEAFRRSSPIYFADGFDGHLVMLHGLRDDNVLAEDVIRLSQRLIELGKENWELALHPVERHAYQRASSWTDQITRAYKLFERTLPADAARPD